MNVAVIGEGDLGNALVQLAVRAGHQASVLPTQLVGAAWAAQQADLLIWACAPSVLRTTVRQLNPGPAAISLVASRGLEAGTGRRLSELITEESACLRVGALGGPLLPQEVQRQSPCALVVASAFREVQEKAILALHSPSCRVYQSSALADVELAGALVEVLAVAVGIARGLGLGVGAQALVVARGIAEGARLARRSGGDPSIFSGLAGVGELVAVAGLPDHPAMLQATALQAGESNPVLADLCAGLLQRERDLPITAGIQALALGKITAKALLTALMERGQRVEGG